jgi:hypothetical protein
MINLLSTEERELIEVARYLPSVSIIVPFEPKVALKTNLAYQLKVMLGKIETALLSNYPADKAQPVINKLQQMIADLNYDTHKKSIAIYVSPIMQKVFYLDVPVKEKVVIDESFEIRDLIYNKKKAQQYLVMVLSANHIRAFYHNNTSLTRLELNEPADAESYRNDVPERVSNFSDPEQRKEILLDKFMHHADNNLSALLKEFNLPVFVLGTERVLGHFKKITANNIHIARFIHGNYEDATINELQHVIQPQVNEWEKKKQSLLFEQIEDAMSAKKLAVGIKEVWQAASQKNAKLLVVEKDFIMAAEHGAEPGIIYPKEQVSLNSFHIKDAVDDIIEKVVLNGGNVEFVENGSLGNYEHIVLIKYY